MSRKRIGPNSMAKEIAREARQSYPVEAPGKAREWWLVKYPSGSMEVRDTEPTSGHARFQAENIRVREVVGNPTEGEEALREEIAFLRSIRDSQSSIIRKQMEESPKYNGKLRELEGEVSRLREGLETLLHGCGNHACRVQKPIGQGTNGPCMCAMNLTGKISKILGAGDDPEKGVEP